MSAGDLLPSGPVTKQGWRLALAALGRALVRLLALLIVAGILAAIFLWAVPALTRRFIVPVEENRERLESFQAGQEQANLELNRRLNRLQAELGTLEAGRTQDGRQASQAIAELQAQLAGAQGDLEGVVQRLDAFERSIAEIEPSLDRLEAAQQANREALRTAAAEEQAGDASVAALRQEIQVLRAMELLIRSRLFLVQSNLGLAREDLEAARSLLAGLEPQVLAYQRDALHAILARLDLAAGNLPDRPVMAADELEIAWDLLVLGLPGEAQATAAASALTPTVPPAVAAGAPVTLTASPAITVTLPITATPILEGTANPAPSLTPAGETPTPTR